MSSGCAPIASMDKGLSVGAVSFSGNIPGSLRQDRAHAIWIPDHPRTVCSLVALFEQCPLLHRVSRRPVALVWVGKHAAVGYQAHHRVFDQVLAFVQVIKNLRPEDEVSAILPLAQ